MDETTVVDYTFPSDNSYLRDVTFRTALIEDRSHARLLGTLTKWCDYSEDEAGEYTEQHVIDVTTEFVDLEKTADLPHRIALIPESAEIREYFAFPMVLRASRNWSHDECPRKPAYDQRMHAAEEAERVKAEHRASLPPGMTSYGTPMTPALDDLEETAEQDGELAARAIDYASRYGRVRQIRGRSVADAFYEALNKGADEWRDLAGALSMTARADRWIAIAQRFGPDAVAQTAGPYQVMFIRTLEDHLRRLGQGGYPMEDPDGPLAPWLKLLAAMERDAKPGLVRRLFRK
jgi:hypothetical protein